MEHEAIQHTEAAQLALKELAQQRRDVRTWLLIAAFTLLFTELLCSSVFGVVLDVTAEARTALFEVSALTLAAIVLIWSFGKSVPLGSATLGLMVYWVAQIVAYGVGALSSKLFVFGLVIKLAVTGSVVRAIVMAVFAASRLRAQGVEIVSPTELPVARARDRQLGAASEKR
jgi:hypothetical protein